MTDHTPTPELVMGEILVIGPNDEEGIPYDEAVIHLEGDEDSEIRISCPGALRLAPKIVAAVNNHDALVKALEEIKACSLCGFSLNGKEDFSQLAELISRFNSELQKRVKIADATLRSVGKPAHD